VRKRESGDAQRTGIEDPISRGSLKCVPPVDAPRTLKRD
jgi:hypothetical protein